MQSKDERPQKLHSNAAHSGDPGKKSENPTHAACQAAASGPQSLLQLLKETGFTAKPTEQQSGLRADSSRKNMTLPCKEMDFSACFKHSRTATVSEYK